MDTKQLKDTIESVEKRLSTVQKRLLQLDTSIRDARKRRAADLQLYVDRFITSEQPVTFANIGWYELNEELPAFMALHDVKVAYKATRPSFFRKLKNIFWDSGEAQLVAGLRLKLSHYLDNHPRFRHHDEAVKRFIEEQEKLSRAETSLREALETLRAKLRPSAVKSIPRTTTRVAQDERVTKIVTEVRNTRDDDDDTFIQTLLLMNLMNQNTPRYTAEVVRDEPFVGRGGTFDGGGASGSWDEPARGRYTAEVAPEPRYTADFQPGTRVMENAASARVLEEPSFANVESGSSSTTESRSDGVEAVLAAAASDPYGRIS